MLALIRELTKLEVPEEFFPFSLLWRDCLGIDICLLFGLFSLFCLSLSSTVFFDFWIFLCEWTLSLVFLVCLDVFLLLPSFFLSYPLLQLPKVWVIILCPSVLLLLYFSSVSDQFCFLSHLNSSFPPDKIIQGEIHCIPVPGFCWLLLNNYRFRSYGKIQN